MNRTLTRKQLIGIYNSVGSYIVKASIEHILVSHPNPLYMLDDEKIELSSKQVDDIFEECPDTDVKILEHYLPKQTQKQQAQELFWEIFNGATVKKEGNNIVYRNKEGQFLFYTTPAGYVLYSNERIWRVLFDKFGYIGIQVNELLNNIFKNSFKLNGFVSVEGIWSNI